MTGGVRLEVTIQSVPSVLRRACLLLIRGRGEVIFCHFTFTSPQPASNRSEVVPFTDTSVRAASRAPPLLQKSSVVPTSRLRAGIAACNAKSQDARGCGPSDNPRMVQDRIYTLLAEVKNLAREYYELTGKPLGVTGEVAEYEASRILGLKLSAARQIGYDAIRTAPGRNPRLQIKGRRMTPSSKPGQRLGAIDLEKEWDAVVLVLLDENYEPEAMYEADRHSVEDALRAPGSKARNVRGQLSVGKFRSIGQRAWPR